MNEVRLVTGWVRETAQRVEASGCAETINVSSVLCDRQHLGLSELRDIATAASVGGTEGLRVRATVSAMPGHAVLVTVSPLPCDPAPLDAAEVRQRLATLQSSAEGWGIGAMVAADRVEELRALSRLFDTVAMYETQLAPLCEFFDVVREAALAAGWKGATFPPREVLATILAHERRRLLERLGPVLAPKRTEAPYFCAECHARGDSVATIAHTDACRIGSDLAREGFPASATLERLIAKDREELVAAWREQVNAAFAGECSAESARDAAIAQARRWKRLVMERRDPRVTAAEAQLRAEREATADATR